MTTDGSTPEGIARDAEIRALTKAHVFQSWSAQADLNPTPLAGGEGAWFWDHVGNKWLDFSSQLVNVNLGYRHPDMTAALKAAAEGLAMVSPAMAHESRARAAEAIAGLAPEGMNKIFFTNGGQDAIENAVKLARGHTGRHKVLSAYRSYHGAGTLSQTLTGEPRRWAAESGVSGVVHFWGPHLYRSEFDSSTPEEESQRSLRNIRRTIEVEGPDGIAAIVMESVVGTNGVLVPPPGFWPGLRALCDEFGIMLIADEVMAGFGRCGSWFAFERFDVAPDLIAFAKGVNSGYVPLGGVVMTDAIADTYAHKPFPGGLTYSGHPLACATAVAAIDIMRRDGVVEHAREVGESVLGPALAELAQRHACIGQVRGIGLMWAVEFVSDAQAKTPLDAATMGTLIHACRAEGIWPFMAGNRLHLVPPLVITADEVRQGVAALERALGRLP
ncbi:aminotransferase class III-fold pyridoxal phosphate-dependent enzyme [Ornithinimicrobium sp. Arc0846-15]|nr:aminotransferase class III-fold pyridoxal phosphate-dependent enzyme [Ornithinimicrobium laminariae]